ncbi:MAG: hypothetical protein HOO95_02670 [Gallionella sp.]|nr:hypothetical protein [Gallionella sp.]
MSGVQQANAEVIDRIEINQVGEQAEIQLHFITRIQFKRQRTLKNGDVRYYVTLKDIKPDDPRLVWEKKGSPPSDIVPPFTVTYPELDSSLTVSFGKVIKTRARVAADGQTLSIFTKAIKAPQAEQIALPIVPTAPVIELPIAAAAVVSAAAAVSTEAAARANASADLPEPVIKVEGAGFPTDLPAENQRTPEQVQQEAQQLFVAASDALQTNQIDASIEALNKVLNLPPNVLTQPAQELMGEAREKNGEFAKARVEYELYLRLYPNAADLKQVQARIANLPVSDAKPVPAPIVSEATQRANDEKLKVTGGISQNYYYGNSHTDAFAIDTNNVTTTTRFGGKDQSQLVTSLDLTAQKRTETKDTRLVLREFNRANFMPDQPEEYRWNAVYLEQSARDRKYMYRLGRQSGSSGGMPGRFDGLAAGYSLNSTWRINAAAGKPVEYIRGGNPADAKTFYSGSIDLSRLPDQWSGSAYGVLQYVGGVGGVLERKALGAEAHYFNQQRSYMTQMEYDTIYQKLNLVSFQGNWTKESGTNFYLSADHRRSPPLVLSLNNQWTQSLKELLGEGTVTLQTLRENAIALSQIFNMISVGMSRPMTPTLRLATDFRVSNIGSSGVNTTSTKAPGSNTITVGTQPGAISTGNQYVWSAQAIGNNLFFDNDLGIANYSYSSARDSKSHSLGFSQVTTFREKWRADLSLQLFNSHSDTSGTTTQVRPSVSINYRKSDTLSFTAESGVEQYHTTATGSESKTLRKYFFVGYRWDLR